MKDPQGYWLAEVELPQIRGRIVMSLLNLMDSSY